MPQPTTEQIVLATAIARRIATYLLGPHDNEGVGVEDVVQDVLIKFFMLDLAQVSNWEAWVVVVAQNRCKDVLRIRRLRRHEAIDLHSDGIDSILPPIRSAGEPAIARDARMELVEGLSVVEKQIVFMHLDGWTYAEIAAHVGFASANSVGVALHRARNKIRARFERPAAERATLRRAPAAA